MLPTVAWEGETIRMVDQRKLPVTETYVVCKTVNDVARAIKTMVIRGAPAIGVSAAMGVALGAARSTATGTKQFTTEFQKNCDLLAATRPTAVNLFWAIERMKQAFAEGAQAGESVNQLKARLRAAADRIHDDDVESCRAIGRHGATVVPEEARILTHCNAGALATAGYGTALGVVRSAHAQGKVALLWVDETRPVMQGSRLTAWECVREGIPHRLIADVAAASVMGRGEVDLVVTGADRIAANGDTANKIGTYALAVLARHHGVPFYVAAPFSTIDPALPTGAQIPIEERDATEIRRVGSHATAPEGSPVYNPAFDVTPARLISAIITERGVFRAPYSF
jgi:methylthioribose-1-phosphate isomerase